MIITITGFPGTQTKEIGKMLGFEIGIKFVSGEEIMKKLENLGDGLHLFTSVCGFSLHSRIRRNLG